MTKGFINDTTLTAIADAIRTKTNTTGAILPADMAGLITMIETSGGVYTGEVTVAATNSSSTIQLGTALPTYTNYCFMITNTSAGNRYGGMKTVVNGVSKSRCYVASNSYTTDWNIRHTNGTASNQYFSSHSGTYRWVYFEL